MKTKGRYGTSNNCVGRNSHGAVIGPLRFAAGLLFTLMLAAANSDAKAKRNASLLELLLSPEEIAEGKRRAQAWLEQRGEKSLRPR